MTEQEVRDFLGQFDKAREDFETWPKWMQDAAVERAATFPKPPATGGAPAQGACGREAVPREFWDLLHEWSDSKDEERRDAIEHRFGELFALASGVGRPAVGVPGTEAHGKLGAETYNTLTCAAFAIRCLQDGVDIGEKLPDTLARIDMMLARGVTVHAPLAQHTEAPAEWARKDMGILIYHLRHDTNFDADLIEKMLGFAQRAAGVAVGDVVRQYTSPARVAWIDAEVTCVHGNGALDVKDVRTGEPYGWSERVCEVVQRAAGVAAPEALPRERILALWAQSGAGGQNVYTDGIVAFANAVRTAGVKEQAGG